MENSLPENCYININSRFLNDVFLPKIKPERKVQNDLKLLKENWSAWFEGSENDFNGFISYFNERCNNDEGCLLNEMCNIFEGLQIKNEMLNSFYKPSCIE
jgi:hypothetical protein